MFQRYFARRDEQTYCFVKFCRIQSHDDPHGRDKEECFIYVIILNRDNWIAGHGLLILSTGTHTTVSVYQYQYIRNTYRREEIPQRRPFPTNELIWGSTFITHVNDEYNMRVLCVTYRIIPLQALSQVAMLRGICEGHCQNHRVRSSSTALADENALSVHSECAIRWPILLYI
jgi:hypothetical protein